MTQPNAGPSSAQPGRPGRMTAVMRAMPVATGPKVLRIGLVQGGKVIEERVIKQRTNVSVGPSEKNTFVVLGPNLPASFKLFELIGADYFLNFVDGMTGRIALQTGPTDLVALKGQAKRSAQGSYQVRLTEDARGKVVVGETTFLFQFVAPPPVQPKPQLPASVKSGVADSIDWSMTIIAAFSFLFHFGAIGTLYSDWADRVLPDEADVNHLVQQMKAMPPPPPVETPTDANANDAAKDKPTEKPAAKPQAANNSAPAAKSGSVSSKQAAAMLNQLDQLNVATLGALSNTNSATANVLRDSNVPTGSLDTFAKSDSAVSNSGTNGLRMGASGGPMTPGGKGSLADVGGGGVVSGTTGPGTEVKVAAPKASVSGSGGVTAGKLSNYDRVIAGARARARGCYQSGLNSNPDMEGSVHFTITVSTSGSVSNVSASPSGSLSAGVVSCIQGALRGLNFDPPDGGSAALAGSFSFVNSNKGKLTPQDGCQTPGDMSPGVLSL